MSDIFTYELDIDMKEEFQMGFDTEAHQLDNVFLKCYMYNEGVLLDTTSYNVEFRAKKPDGTDYIQRKYGIEKGVGYININCTDELTIASGMCKAELRIWNSNLEQSTSRIINIRIIPSVLEVDRTISKSTITELQYANNTLDSLNDYLESAEAFLEEHPDIVDLDYRVTQRMQDIISIMKSVVKTTTTKHIKLIGDSITAGLGGTGYNPSSIGGGSLIYGSSYQNVAGHCWANSLKDYLESNFNCSVKNYGIGGLNSSVMVSNLSSLIETDDDIIICMIGTNNRHLTDGVNALINDLTTIYNYVKNLNKEIIFMSSIPAKATNEATETYTMQEIDNAIMYFATKESLQYISLYKLFVEYCESRKQNQENVMFDDVHPNDLGYDIIYYLVLNELGFATPKSFDGADGKILLTNGYDLNNCTVFDTEYYTDLDSTAQSCLNIPIPTIRSFHLKFYRVVKNSTTLYGVHELTDRLGTQYIRYVNEYGWSTWLKKATITDTGWIDIPLNSGINNYEGASYRKVNNQVFIRGRVSGITANGALIGTLPVGFRPNQQKFYNGNTNGYNNVIINIKIDGTITYFGSTITISGTNYVAIETSFFID